MNYLVSGNAPIYYPVETLFGVLRMENGKAMEIPSLYPFHGTWGTSLSNVYNEPTDLELPKKLDVVYLSIIEEKFYSLEASIPFREMDEAFKKVNHINTIESTPHIVIGMAPYGVMALWVESSMKSFFVSTFNANEISVSMKVFRPWEKNMSLKDVCNHYINELPKAKQHLEQSGLPPRDLFDNYMKQFTYRYLPLFQHWDKDKDEWRKYDGEETLPELDYIDEALFDGTHDKLHDGGLLKYHQAGKPKKLAVTWHIKKAEYAAYFWFNDEAIREAFDHFYGVHPDTKADFMIRIDAEKNKYELALYRYGLKEPQVIGEDAYQMIVFKNKFECYRSRNYDQPRGAWIW